jgi:hypothetical protein
MQPVSIDAAGKMLPVNFDVMEEGVKMHSTKKQEDLLGEDRYHTATTVITARLCKASVRRKLRA